MDKFIVRIAIIALTIYLIVSIYNAWNGVLLYEYDSLFSCSLTTGILLSILTNSQGRYHCVYMRGLCYNLIFTPSINFIDTRYGLFEDAETLLVILSLAWTISVLSTLYLAIRHFYKVRKVLNKR